jgi:hypothetical protein
MPNVRSLHFGTGVGWVPKQTRIIDGRWRRQELVDRRNREFIPVGLTISDATIDGNTVKVWISDAVLYTEYDLSCGIVTLGGRTAIDQPF